MCVPRMLAAHAPSPAPPPPDAPAMNPSRIFILRPVATSLLTAGVLLVGAVAYLQLPISALPQVDSPTIQIVTFYPGASPDATPTSTTTPPARRSPHLPG